MTTITGKMISDTVKRVEQRGALEVAIRVLDTVGMVFVMVVKSEWSKPMLLKD